MSPDESTFANTHEPPDPVAMQTTRAKEGVVAQWASTVRESFGKDRKGYNFAVCDALAAAGIQPTGLSLLRVGRWGTSSSVGTDVGAWYASIASRLTSLEATIPMSARRTANQLLEQLFGVAEQAAGEKVNSLLEPLQEEATRLTEELASAQTASEARLTLLGEEIAKNGALKVQLSDAEQRVSRMDTELAEVRQALERANMAALSDRQVASEVLTQIERRLTQAEIDKANTAREHAQTLLAAGQRSEEERKRLLLAADAERQEHAKRLKALDGELSSLRSKNEGLRQEVSTLGLEAATFRAAAETAQGLLSMEQRRATDLERQLQSDEVRFQTLLDFVATSRKGGLTIHRSVEPQKAEEWLINALGMTPMSAQYLVANAVPEQPLKADGKAKRS